MNDEQQNDTQATPEEGQPQAQPQEGGENTPEGGDDQQAA